MSKISLQQTKGPKSLNEQLFNRMGIDTPLCIFNVKTTKVTEPKVFSVNSIVLSVKEMLMILPKRRIPSLVVIAYDI